MRYLQTTHCLYHRDAKSSILRYELKRKKADYYVQKFTFYIIKFTKQFAEGGMKVWRVQWGTQQIFTVPSWDNNYMKVRS